MRLDQLLVTRGLAESRARAKAAIEAGGVTVDGAPAKSGSQTVGANAEIGYADAHRWVGRGALKLDHALTVWPVAVEGRVVLDVGASTGGFTEVCLDRGAARVFAVDVGFGQMHERVAADPRVVSLERTDARDLTPDLIPERPSLIVCDASFISLIKVLPVALDLAADEADLITLVKPQFEADGPGGVGKKGVVKDPVAHASAVARVADWLEALGWAVQATTESPITGGDGNIEFLLWARRA
ncbi:MAG: TlyA family RNA methyltransferase [Alphaproteobacteria bacterium]|jgi:23S rRNA (cytidine1920-2'-O)/16S rRNA (cytidine1409-2'-O)-methyltransferase|uniref:TlyA family RNA methyltransferase n=1 Tax=Brevundimonas sp. TaxID=1871086 RepID=UPI000DB2B750|nr:TlyA family RNA methyltransferase [Brevundimonas sp.]MBU1272409.1 TlyA family RNA methyltransferase [Alphaproteobacteria bacterium]MBJ7317804.1 TlyA family RNA methyltransferase [Brevundimonas sp.]MBU1521878.1 TlyA family RNA methyltransferase [Alphaproteobacteria bacterium]MBU2030347.1 TlyA family RNA methyltransferase [Alphaproteobacteria bacterium]MBU2163036.1 TlyA family RNA methyltransferase [Alphaproteobacteria bacterium]